MKEKRKEKDRYKLPRLLFHQEEVEDGQVIVKISGEKNLQFLNILIPKEFSRQKFYFFKIYYFFDFKEIFRTFNQYFFSREIKVLEVVEVVQRAQLRLP